MNSIKNDSDIMAVILDIIFRFPTFTRSEASVIPVPVEIYFLFISVKPKIELNNFNTLMTNFPFI